MVKVGDKVRCLVTEFDVVAGDEYEVKRAVYGGVYIHDDVDAEYFLASGEYEPIAVAASNSKEPKFKVGDRIRSISEDSTGGFIVGGEYTVSDVYFEYGWRVRVEEDSVGSTTNGWGEDNFEPVAAATQPQLRIQAGRYYKTRDGRKVGPMKEWGRVCIKYPWESEGYLWKDDGENYDKDSEHTIVAEWTDEPAATDTDAPKFKVGDRVENPDVPRAGHGVIAAVNSDGTYQVVYEDDMFGECCDPEHMLRLVAEATSGFTVPLDAPEFAEKEARFLPDGYALRNAVEMVRTGCCTINEVRNVIGLPPITSGHLLATL